MKTVSVNRESNLVTSDGKSKESKGENQLEKSSGMIKCGNSWFFLFFFYYKNISADRFLATVSLVRWVCW